MIRPSDLGLGQRFLALVSLATALGTAPLVFGQNANVTTQHNDNSRTGAYLFEKTLTPAAVKSRQMRVRWTHPLDGAIATQPLYVEDTFAGDAFAAILIGTTPNNSVYALDADTGAEIWHKALADSNPALRPLPRGINSTPVIDVCSHRIYLLFSTKNQVVDAAGDTAGEAQLTGLDVAYWLVALDYHNGNELGRVQVAASATRSNGTVVNFVAKNQYDRPALLLDDGYLYLAFGMRFREEIIEYHGWVIRYRASDLSPQGAFCTSKDATVPTSPFTFHIAEGSGIWQGGGGLSADSAGNVYFLTGNGTADVPSGKFGDAFIKLSATGTNLTATAYVPPGAATLYANDADLGSGGTMVIPATNLVVGGGKTGYMYLLDQSSMSLVQQLTASTNQYDPTLRDQSWDAGPHLHGSPTYWRGPDPTFGYLYIWGEKDYLRLYRFNTGTNLFETSPLHIGSIEALPDTMPGGMMSISANGKKKGTGIVWATLPDGSFTVPGANAFPGHIYAFDAETLDLLWDKPFSSLGKWLSPTIADGKVFVGTSSNEMIAYELARRPHKPPHHRHYPRKPHRPIGPGPKIIPLHQRYDDEESIRALPPLILVQLAPPAGNVRILALRAEGTQVVDKSSSKAGATTWRLNTAAADLYEDNPDLRGKKVKALVRLSPGPTWTASDGSSITGELEKTAGAPDKTAAPWALFKITRRSGKGILANVSYVQCVFTELDASQIAVRQDSQGRLPYRANYIFYRPR